jgi:hypothetical protein
LLLLKHIYGLSDEGICERWIHDPYFQHFTSSDSTEKLTGCEVERAYVDKGCGRVRCATQEQNPGCIVAAICKAATTTTMTPSAVIRRSWGAHPMANAASRPGMSGSPMEE